MSNSPSSPLLLVKRTLSNSLILASIASVGFSQEVAHNPDPLSNNSALQELVQGALGVQRLGDGLADLAKRSGMDVAEFEQRVLNDESLWVNLAGEVVFVDPFFVDGDGDSEGGDLERSGPPIPLSEAFLLHSRPGSNYTIYLDYDGHRSVNNGWGHDITFPPFSRDGNSSFSNTELQEIIDNWRYMAEDFAIFDVDVTTEEPPLSRLQKTSGADTTWGVRDIHTQATDGFGNGIGGVAFLFSFNSSQDRPVFSFNKGSNNGSMTGSHEVGHSLGLSHDGLSGSEYHPGSSLGNWSWGPIMGAPFGAKMVQWSNGDYVGSSTTQDDVVIISSSSNGTSILPDDHGDTIGTATTIAGACPTPNQAKVYAQINTRTELDAFKFTSNGGLVSITCGPETTDGIVGNIDVFLTLYDPAGVKLVGSNPSRQQSATITRMIGPGEHTITIDGAIQGNLYSDYGSLGTYILDVTFPGPTSDFTDLGNSLAGAAGPPLLTPTGFACVGAPIDLNLSAANPNSVAFLAYGVSRIDLPIFGGVLVPDPGAGGALIMSSTNATGDASVSHLFPPGIGSGAVLYFQYWVKDPGGPKGWAASNAAVLMVP